MRRHDGRMLSRTPTGGERERERVTKRQLIKRRFVGHAFPSAFRHTQLDSVYSSKRELSIRNGVMEISGAPTDGRLTQQFYFFFFSHSSKSVTRTGERERGQRGPERPAGRGRDWHEVRQMASCVVLPSGRPPPPPPPSSFLVFNYKFLILTKGASSSSFFVVIVSE